MAAFVAYILTTRNFRDKVQYLAVHCNSYTKLLLVCVCVCVCVCVYMHTHSTAHCPYEEVGMSAPECVADSNHLH